MNIQLKDGHYYWLEGIKYHKIYIGMYDADWVDGGCFSLTGDEEVYKVNEFIILGEVEIPDYVDKEKGFYK